MKHKGTKLKGNSVAECQVCNDLRVTNSYGCYYIDDFHNVRDKAGECKGDITHE